VKERFFLILYFRKIQNSIYSVFSFPYFPCRVIIKFIFLRSNLNFNRKFDYKFGTRGLKLNCFHIPLTKVLSKYQIFWHSNHQRRRNYWVQLKFLTCMPLHRCLRRVFGLISYSGCSPKCLSLKHTNKRTHMQHTLTLTHTLPPIRICTLVF